MVVVVAAVPEASGDAARTDAGAGVAGLPAGRLLSLRATCGLLCGSRPG